MGVCVYLFLDNLVFSILYDLKEIIIIVIIIVNNKHRVKVKGKVEKDLLQFS